MKPMKRTQGTTYLPRPRRLANATPKRSRLVEPAAIATTAAFAGGCLLTQFVTVPHWRSMDPAAFLPHFKTAGPATGAVLFPIEVASVLLLATTTSANVKEHRPGRTLSALAAAGMAGTGILLPVYFARANIGLLDPEFPLEDVPAELSSWYRWNWARTGLAVAASALSCAALAANRNTQTKAQTGSCNGFRQN